MCIMSSCKNRTSLSPYCRHHLNNFWNVDITDSEFLKKFTNEKGLGLYAFSPSGSSPVFRKGDIICAYNGPKIAIETCPSKEDILESNMYLMEVKENIVIDASEPTSCIARFVNDPTHSPGSSLHVKANAEFVANMSYHVILIAKFNIYHGDEILAPYGETYWRQDVSIKT